MLIEYGAEVNARDDVEMTLLFQHSLNPLSMVAGPLCTRRLNKGAKKLLNC